MLVSISRILPLALAYLLFFLSKRELWQNLHLINAEKRGSVDLNSHPKIFNMLLLSFIELFYLLDSCISFYYLIALKQGMKDIDINILLEKRKKINKHNIPIKEQIKKIV